MQNIHRALLKIIKASLLDTAVAAEDGLDYKEILKLSRKHQIVPLVFNGLYRHCGDTEEAELLRKYTYRLICHDQNQLYYLEKIKKCFGLNDIDYMLLKGASLKKYYPASELRLMGDIDILIKEEQYAKIRGLLSELGLTESQETNHEIVWCGNSGIVIELHKRLIPSYNDDYYAYYCEPWTKAQPMGENCYSMSPEDEYIYIFTHLTKHYRDGGIGLRHIIDIYFFKLKNPLLDMEYITQELKLLELDKFHENILNTIDVWFNDKNETELSDYITERIIESGSFGIKEKWDLAGAARKCADTGSASAAKRKSIISLVFMPYSSMKKKYPILDKIPVLLPLMWTVRWIDAIINKKSNIARQSERISKIDKQLVDSYNKELEMVGLKFKHKKILKSR